MDSSSEDTPEDDDSFDPDLSEKQVDEYITKFRYIVFAIIVLVGIYILSQSIIVSVREDQLIRQLIDSVSIMFSYRL